MSKLTNGVMLNAYPDSLGGTLSSIVEVLSKSEFKDVFDAFYILPSVFNTDLDRGFSIIDYSLNEVYASKKDIADLKELGISLKFDFVLNHLSVLSHQFQDIVKNGEKSKYKDFFINWNTFWAGCGELDENGLLKPDEEYIKDMFFRKPSLPILNVRYPSGDEVPYWNTFYQSVSYNKVSVTELINTLNMQYVKATLLKEYIDHSIDYGLTPSEMNFSDFSDESKIRDLLESKREYLGQMDLNINSSLVWDFYDETLNNLSSYGASIVRLDAFAYSSKVVGKKNFFNLPETWDDLEKVRVLASMYNLELLPEIHSKYEEKLHEEICERGFLTYDFFLPGLILDALKRGVNTELVKWANDIKQKDLRVVNMLGCHDGIPLLDLKGLLSDELIDELIEDVVSKGGYVKNLHGNKKMYYQVNATYFSALGEDEKKLELARAIQIFMPGKPQVWYLDLFAGTNDYEALKRGGAGSHKEINRTNLSLENIEDGLLKPVVLKQLELLRFRNTYPAFGFDSEFTINESSSKGLSITWKNGEFETTLDADLTNYTYHISKK